MLYDYEDAWRGAKGGKYERRNIYFISWRAYKDTITAITKNPKSWWPYTMYDNTSLMQNPVQMFPVRWLS